MARNRRCRLSWVGSVARSDWTRFLGLGRVHQMEGALLPQGVFWHYQCCETGRYLNSSGTRLAELSFDCPSLLTVSVP